MRRSFHSFLRGDPEHYHTWFVDELDAETKPLVKLLLELTSDKIGLATTWSQTGMLPSEAQKRDGFWPDGYAPVIAFYCNERMYSQLKCYPWPAGIDIDEPLTFTGAEAFCPIAKSTPCRRLGPQYVQDFVFSKYYGSLRESLRSCRYVEIVGSIDCDNARFWRAVCEAVGINWEIGQETIAAIERWKTTEEAWRYYKRHAEQRELEFQRRWGPGEWRRTRETQRQKYMMQKNIDDRRAR